MTGSSTIPEAPTSEITFTRVLDATPARVFKAWTDAEQFTRWWGPRGFSAPLSKISMDAVPGGMWRATMVSDVDGTEIPMAGVYREVVEPERLVFTLLSLTPDGAVKPDQVGEETVSLTFTDLGAQTKVSFHQAGHLDAETLAKAKAGWPTFFDCLAEHLTTGKS
jgi:uncharacterized protein YndB with AHSA1/START domain